MKISDFAQSNIVYTAPLDWDEWADGVCNDLPVLKIGNIFTSCWKLDSEDIFRLQSGDALYVSFYGGDSHPPIALQVNSWVSKEDGVVNATA
jgi:hypothetical protein